MAEQQQPASLSLQIEEALRQAHKMEALGQMAAGLAHDFNNMLQGVVGALDIMQTRINLGQTGDLGGLLEVALMSLNRTASFTQSLLAFARPHSPDFGPVGVNAVIRSMRALLKCTVGERISLELILADGLSPAVCDPHQLENAVLNLAINARDAMPNGGKLVIETCHADLVSMQMGRTGRYINIRVADTGLGMSPDVADRAFDPFYTTKPAGSGTGLGLAMTKHFVERYRGCVNIQSDVGRGTSINLYLPCRRDDDEKAAVDPATMSVSPAL
jgi:signal transduction histidine kinase